LYYDNYTTLAIAGIRTLTNSVEGKCTDHYTATSVP